MPKQKQWIADFMDRLWNQKDLGAIEECFADGVTLHSPLGERYGPSAMIGITRIWLEAFPDLTLWQEDIIEQGDLVFSHWGAKGTHLGAFQGLPPSQQEVTYKGVSIFRVSQRKVVDYWAYLDLLHVLEQCQATAIPERPTNVYH